MARPSFHPPELRKRAVRMVAEVRGDYPNEFRCDQCGHDEAGYRLAQDAAQVGPAGPDRLRTTFGDDAEESAQIKAIQKEIVELRRANEILKAAASFFAAEPDRPLACS